MLGEVLGRTEDLGAVGCYGNGGAAEGNGEVAPAVVALRIRISKFLKAVLARLPHWENKVLLNTQEVFINTR